MISPKNFMIFLCSGATKAGNKKISFEIASHLESIGVGKVGSLEDLSAQHNASLNDQRRMIFINDCRSGCVNVLTHGFRKQTYVYIDVSRVSTTQDLDIAQYVNEHVLPVVTTELIID